MYEDFTQERISQLRIQHGSTARDMSLSLGQNDTYINKIENKKALPSLQGLFYICEYLGITPQEFFDADHLNKKGAVRLAGLIRPWMDGCEKGK